MPAWRPVAVLGAGAGLWILAVGLELLVSALAGPDHSAVVLAARPEHDPVPAFRALAQGLRLPGDAGCPASKPPAHCQQRRQHREDANEQHRHAAGTNLVGQAAVLDAQRGGEVEAREPQEAQAGDDVPVHATSAFRPL